MSKPSSALDLRARTLAQIASTPSRTRKQWLFAQYTWLAVALLLFTGLALLHGDAAIRARPQAYVWTFSLTFAAVALFAARNLSAFLRTPLGPSHKTLALLRWATVPALALGTLAANLAAPETFGWPKGDMRVQLSCCLAVVGSGAFVGALALRAVGSTDPVTPRGGALTLGAFVGALAVLSVTLQCEFADPLHVLLTHVLPVAIVLAGMVRWGARTLRGEKGAS